MVSELKPGDIVQITDEKHQWFPCFLVVWELKGFGILGYITIPTNGETRNDDAFIRINTEQFVKVGEAVIALENVKD